MFREFNVKFEDVEMLGGADNLLEGTEITKVIVRGDNNKMSSLDSMLKNCNELDTVDGELDLKGVSDIDNLLEGTELVKSIDLKNINNENISANNSFPHIEEINIGGEVYDKKAMQNVIASKDWTFDNITYSGTVGDNVVTKEVNIIDDNKVTIQDTLEQKTKGIEIIGQTYENLVVGSGEATLLDELTLESVDGNSKEFNPHLEQPVCLESIEGETYQNLIEGKGEYKLTDTFSTTWTESNNSIENPPSMIEIPEIWGNTVQGVANIVTAQMIVDSINNSDIGCTATLKSDKKTLGVSNATVSNPPSNSDNFIQLKANTTYSLRCYRLNSTQIVNVATYHGDNPTNTVVVSQGGSFTTDSSGKVLFYPHSVQGETLYFRCVEGEVNLSDYDLYEFDLNYIQSVGDLYVDEEGSPILDEEGNEQYKLEIVSHGVNLWNGKSVLLGRMSNGKLELNGMWTENERLLEDEYGIGWTVKGSSMRGLTLDNILVEANKPLYFSFDYSHHANVNLNSNNLWVNCFDVNGVYISTISGSVLYKTDSRIGLKSGILPTNCHSVKICYYQSYHTTDGINDYTMKNIMVTQEDRYDFEAQGIDKTTILMPQPLRKIKGYSPKPYYKTDKLYWDNEKGNYFIEKNIDIGVVDLSNCTVSWSGYASSGYYDITFDRKDIYDNIKTKFTIGDTNICMIGTGFILTTPYWLVCQNNGNFKPSECISFKYSNNSLQYRTTNTNLTNEDLTEIFRSKSPIIVYGGLNAPQIVETKILEKPSLETYSPKTYISANTEIQPSQMTVTNKRNLINLKKMKANTDYTVQLKCNEKGNKPIKINLCGKEKDIDATIGVNHVNITTNELNDNKLELSGEGNIVSEIIVVEGEMSQYPKYFNGVQSTGELQGDGTYRIGIKTNEGFNISVQTNNPLAKGDKLYWNKSNKRYEIDRGGSIEVPTVSGDIIDLPRLYQREDTHFSTSTGNIKPSKVKLDYNDLD